MAATQTRRGKGELERQAYDLVLSRARAEGWTEPNQSYGLVSRELKIDRNRIYVPTVKKAIAKALAAAMLAPVEAHKQNGNGAAHHAAPAPTAAEQKKYDDALTMAQRVILRDATYIAVLEAIIEARFPDTYLHLRAVREAIQ